MTSSATAAPGTRLRYFDCRSRGQALRFALADSDVQWEDERVPIAGLAAFRESSHRPEVGGPFGSLPVLEWHGHTVAQTLAIASFLAAVLGPKEGSPKPEARAFLDMISSAAHLDMQAPYSQLLWLPEECPREELRSAGRALLSHLVVKIGQMEALLARAEPREPFFGGRDPTVADYFVYESLSRGCDVFADAFERALRAAPALSALRSAMDARPRIEAYRRAGRVPYRVTASPSEPVLRARLVEDLPTSPGRDG